MFTHPRTQGRQRTLRALVLPLTAATVLAGGACTSSASDDVPAEIVHSVNGTVSDAQADALWEHRSAYVGDNSKVIALASDAGFGPAGAYQLRLHTAMTPYAVEIAFTQAVGEDGDNVPAGPDSLEPAAIKLLGTVANLDQVIVTRPGQTTFTLTAAQASSKLGYDVKDLGRDHDKLTAYVVATPG